jgi:hypothetical protein
MGKIGIFRLLSLVVSPYLVSPIYMCFGWIRSRVECARSVFIETVGYAYYAYQYLRSFAVLSTISYRSCPCSLRSIPS